MPREKGRIEIRLVALYSSTTCVILCRGGKGMCSGQKGIQVIALGVRRSAVAKGKEGNLDAV